MPALGGVREFSPVHAPVTAMVHVPNQIKEIRDDSGLLAQKP